MSVPTRRLPPQGEAVQRLPTLTEVIEPAPAVDDLSAAPPEQEAAKELPALAPQVAIEPLPTEADLTASVLDDVQRQVDVMLEHRLREALMPALLQATDAIVLQARTELASTLRDVVSRAVVQALSRHR